MNVVVRFLLGLSFWLCVEGGTWAQEYTQSIELKLGNCQKPIAFPKWLGKPQKLTAKHYWNLVKADSSINPEELGLSGFSASLGCIHPSAPPLKRNFNLKYFEDKCAFAKMNPTLESVRCNIEWEGDILYYFQSHNVAAQAAQKLGVKTPDASRYWFEVRDGRTTFNISGGVLPERAKQGRKLLVEAIRMVGGSL